jgi:hypothetical protein
MTEENINAKYKDRLFTILFGRSENKAWALELYNAMNGSHYDNLDDIEVTTMEDALYMGMKNDASYILNEYMNIYEQQSTFNPNMPIRQLMYAGKLYDKYINAHDLNIYGSKVLHLPIPKLVVFYNGTDKDVEEERILYLSNAFKDGDKKGEADITARVRMLNINAGYNGKLLEACKPLGEYSWLIDRIRYYKKEHKLEIEEAVDRAIDEMPENSVILPFLIGHRAEVKMSCLTEYDEAKTMAYLRREALEEGHENGLREGLIAKSKEIILKKVKKGMALEAIASDMEENVEDIKELYDEVCAELGKQA